MKQTDGDTTAWQRRGALIGLLLLLGCGPNGAKDPTEEDAEPAVPVVVTTVERGDIDARYSGTTTLTPQSEATVAAKVGGIVESLTVEEGTPVRAGDVLAQLDRERLALEVDRARTDWQQAESEFARSARVHAQNILSREAYEQSRYARDAAKTALALAELALRESTITAPLDGVIARRHIRQGHTVQAGTAVFDIVQTAVLEAELHVPERDLRRLQVGQPARAQVDAWPDRRFDGDVLRISPVVDADSGTSKVTVRIPNPDGALRPGMFARVNVLFDRRTDVLLVPKDAVMIEDARASVFTVVEGKARRQVIELGYSDDTRHEV
ncbi:MAG: efflux RND transporter periplasmic adaptor subunit, partial [Oceanococcaceae bacterium]